MRRAQWSVVSGVVASLAVAGLTVGFRTASAGGPQKDNPCTTAQLIAAITTANSGSGGTITLASGCTFAFSVRDNSTDGGNDLPTIKTPITIIGSGDTLIHNSGTAGRAFDVVAGSLTLSDVQLTGFSGNASGGGAIWTHPGTTTTLNRVALVGNTNTTGNGGAIRNNGTTTINDSLIYNNSAPAATGVGGGVSNGQGTVTITRSTIINNSAGNTAGGVWAYASTTVNGSIVAGNTSPHNGDCGQAVANSSYDVAGDATCAFSVRVRTAPERRS